jgi:hypothetical protein
MIKRQHKNNIVYFALLALFCLLFIDPVLSSAGLATENMKNTINLSNGPVINQLKELSGTMSFSLNKDGLDSFLGKTLPQIELSLKKDPEVSFCLLLDNKGKVLYPPDQELPAPINLDGMLDILPKMAATPFAIDLSANKNGLEYITILPLHTNNTSYIFGTITKPPTAAPSIQNLNE